MKINSFKYREAGLNRFLGPVEAKIMELIWASGAATIKDIQMKLEKEHPLTFNTVMTIMNRLVEKGMLKKETSGRQSVFRATQSQNEFLLGQTREVTRGLLHDFEEMTVTHFADLLEQVKPELLDKLQEKLNEAKRRGRDEKGE